MTTQKKLIIIGAGGHAKVVLDIALNSGYEVLGYLDDNGSNECMCGYPVLGPVSQCMNYIDDADIEFVIGIGNNHNRAALARKYPLKWATLIHPTAVIGREVSIGEGTVVMANAVINPGAVVGCHVIINTAAIVEHDNRIGNYAHICPGTVLAGTVLVGDTTLIGARSVVRNNISIASDCVIGCGAVVVSDIVTCGRYKGIPAKKF